MTEISRFWSGRTSEGAPGDSGPYSDDQMSQTLATMFGQSQDNRGVLRGVLEELEVTPAAPADSTVIVEPGSALVQGRWYLNDADLSVAIASNASGSTRIDIVVLEADFTAQTVRIAVVQGTPAAGLPALTQTGLIWQIPLAYLTLASGFTTIAASAITDLRHYANIPDALGIPIVNNSGSTLEIGTLVYLFASGGGVAPTGTEGQRNLLGVIESRILNGANGRAIVQGIFPVMCDELVAAGALLEASTTAGQAQAMLRGGAFARVITANTGAGTRCLAYLNVLADPALIVTGTYTGNGAATQAITGLGFKPRIVQIWRQSASQPLIMAEKTDREPTTNAIIFAFGGAGLEGLAPYQDDAIRSLDADGFTVGDTTGLSTNFTNINLSTYTFKAWR